MRGVGTGAQYTIRNAFWIAPWFAGQVLIGWLGRYGNGSRNLLPNWVDIAVVTLFSLAIFYWAVSLTLTREQTAAAVGKDWQQLVYESPAKISDQKGSGSRGRQPAN